MRIMIKKDEMDYLSTQLKSITLQLEDMTHLISEQMIEDANFTGEMVDAYQRYLQELMKEHKKLIQFYQDLSKEMKEMVKDFDEKEDLLIKKIENL